MVAQNGVHSGLTNSALNCGSRLYNLVCVFTTNPGIIVKAFLSATPGSRAATSIRADWGYRVERGSNGNVIHITEITQEPEGDLECWCYGQHSAPTNSCARSLLDRLDLSQHAH